jgi:DNA-binding NarL/FixJ family response regulator
VARRRTALPPTAPTHRRRSSGGRARVMLADDHPMMLEGLGKILAPHFDVVGTAADGRALLEAAARLRPDLVIADVSMPEIDGIEATRRLRATDPGIRVLILSVHGEPSGVRAAFAAGARGYLTKSSVADEIELAVREILDGRFYVSPIVAHAAIVQAEGAHPPEARETLTPREHEIAGLVGAGLPNLEIARRLGVSVTTVRSHLKKVYSKLRLASRIELALLAAQSASPAM